MCACVSCMHELVHKIKAWREAVLDSGSHSWDVASGGSNMAGDPIGTGVHLGRGSGPLVVLSSLSQATRSSLALPWPPSQRGPHSVFWRSVHFCSDQ
jgi:hypothetical protein